MLRQTCLLTAFLALAGCTTPPPPKAPPPTPAYSSNIIGGLKLDSSGNVERQLTPAEVEELRRKDEAKYR